MLSSVPILFLIHHLYGYIKYIIWIYKVCIYMVYKVYRRDHVILCGMFIKFILFCLVTMNQYILFDNLRHFNFILIVVIVNHIFIW